MTIPGPTAGHGATSHEAHPHVLNMNDTWAGHCLLIITDHMIIQCLYLGAQVSEKLYTPILN